MKIVHKDNDFRVLFNKFQKWEPHFNEKLMIRCATLNESPFNVSFNKNECLLTKEEQLLNVQYMERFAYDI